MIKPNAPSIPKVIMMLLAINIIGVMLTISIINFNFSEIHSVNKYLTDLSKKSDTSLNQTIANQNAISDKLAHNFRMLIDAGSNRTATVYAALSNLTKQIDDTQNADNKILTSISSTNIESNKTINKAGGFQALIDDIHDTHALQKQNHDLLVKLTNQVNSNNVSVKILLAKLANKTA